MYEGKRVHFDVIPWRCQLPLPPSFTYHEVQERNWQPLCVHNRRKPWHAGLGAGAGQRQAGVCGWQRFWGPVLLSTAAVGWPGTPERCLTAGIKIHLMSCAFFFITYDMKSENFQTVRIPRCLFFCLISVFVLDCVWAVTRSENALNKRKQCWNKWKPSTWSSLNNPCIYFGNLFLLFLFPVPVCI